MESRASDPWDHPIGHTGEGPGSRIAVYGCGGKAIALWSAASTKPEPAAEAFAWLSAQSV